jgi:xylulokinase
MMLKTNEYLIGLDLGTTGLKGVLVDAQNRIVSEASVSTTFESPEDGWVEVPAEQHLENVCSVIRQLAEAANGGSVVALAMAGATGNTLLTTADGVPLTPIINWMDSRCDESASALVGLTADEVKKVAGWPCITSFPLGHLAWLKDNRPDIYRQAEHVGMAADWIIFKFTGRWVMDYSTASTFLLQNQVENIWHEPFLDRFEITPDKLADLCPSGTPIGPLTAAAAERLGLSTDTLVVAGSFDHPAAARAAGVVAPGQLMLSCGTSWVGFFPDMDRDRLIKYAALCDPFLSDEGGPWGGIFYVPAIGRTIDWYIDNVVAPGEAEPHAVFNALAASVAPGAGGLTIDLRERPQAPDATPARVARAVMEGAANLLTEHLDALRAHGFVYDEAVMVGGPSESELWASILADIARLRLIRGGRNSGARGAAMLAGIGIEV